jgi:L-seryl-tRNA(Ser) seleniumtransferase
LSLNILRKIPKVDLFLKDPELVAELKGRPSFFLKRAVNEVLENLRRELLSGKKKEFSYEELKEEVKRELRKLLRPKLHKVINATGVVLHTNLGRAPISEEVAEHLKEIITGYSNLEYDLKKGKRGLRYRNLEWVLK